MTGTWGAGLKGALLSSGIYIVIGGAIAATTGPEVIASAALFLVMCLPLAAAVGAAVGIKQRHRPTRSWLWSVSLAGTITPIGLYLAVLLWSALNDAETSGISAQKRAAELEKAKQAGFVFPKSARLGITGQVWTDESLAQVDAFYRSNFDSRWTRIKAGSKIWYLRSRQGFADRIELRREYNTTSIYFASFNREKYRLVVGDAFLAGVRAQDWPFVAVFSPLQPSVIKSKMHGVEITSSTFDRPPFIAANIKRPVGQSGYQSGEVLLTLSESEIPKVLDVRLPEGW